MWEGVGDRTETAIFWPPLLWPSTLCLPCSPGLLNQRPRGPLCWVICYILSATSLHPNSYHSVACRGNPLFGKFFFFLFFFFFLLTTTRPEIWLSICMSKFQRTLFVSIYRTNPGLCISHFFAWLNLSFLHSSQWISFPTQSCLVLYPFCANLLHLLNKLIDLSRSPHNLHLLFCCVLSIFALT